jgi:hypothetical protein
MQMVPVITPYAIPILLETNVADLIAISDAQNSLLTHEIAEGIVYKSHVVGGPTFKVISNKFLLKEKD